MGVLTYRLKDYASDAEGNLGSFGIYTNSPSFHFEMDGYWGSTQFWWNINGHNITKKNSSDNDGDPIKNDINELLGYYVWYTGTPTFETRGGAFGRYDLKTQYINFLYPWETSIGSETAGNPGYAASKSFSLFNKIDVAAGGSIFGSVFENEHFSVSITNSSFIDNTFVKNNPTFGISGSNMTITMTNSGLPNLINPNNDSEIAQSSTVYNIPWSAGSNTTYRLKNHIPTPSVSAAGGGEADLTFNGIKFYNDEVTIQMRQLAAPSISHSNGVLSWAAINGASSYDIYLDGKWEANTTSTSWTIPSAKYLDQKHSYKVLAIGKTDSSFKYVLVEGKQTPSSSKESYPIVRYSTYTYYRNSGYSNELTGIGVLTPPTVSATRTKPDEWKFVLSDTLTLGARSYYYKIGAGTTSLVSGNELTLSNLTVDTRYDVYFYVVSTIEGTSYWSEATYYGFTPTKVPTATFTTSNASKLDANKFMINFTTSTNSVFSSVKYNVYLNGFQQASDVKGSCLLSDWLCEAKNTVRIDSIYEDPSSNNTTKKAFNNSISVDFGPEFTPKLATPTLEVINNTGKVSIQVGEFNDEMNEEIHKNKEIITNVDIKVKFPIQYTGGYLIRDDYKYFDVDADDWVEDDKEETLDASDTEFNIQMSNIIGYHRYSIQAVFPDDPTYNSNFSNIAEIKQNFPLPKPEITYVNGTTEFTIQEPVPVGNIEEDDPYEVITQEAINNIDFFSLQLIPTMGTTRNVFNSFVPTEYPQRYSFYDVLNNKIKQNPEDDVWEINETETFIGSVFARSYNAFYFHPSEESDVKISVEVIKLNRPSNVLVNNGVLTWTGDVNAYKYRIDIKGINEEWSTLDIVDNDIKRKENGDILTLDQTYTIPSLAPSLYQLRIVALRDENRRTLPIYINSEYSEVESFGALETPKSFERTVNTFSWEGLGRKEYAPGIVIEECSYLFHEFIYNPGKGQYSLEIIPDKVSLSGDKMYKAKLLSDAEANTGDYDIKEKAIAYIHGSGTFIALGMAPDDTGDLLKLRPTEGKHFYTVRAETVFNGDYYVSDFSDVIEVDIRYIQQLNPAFEIGADYTTNKIVWDPAVINLLPEDIGKLPEVPVVYDKKVNNLIQEKDKNTYYEINSQDDYGVGEYKFTARPHSTEDEFLFQQPLLSEPITYSVIELSPPEIFLTKENNGKTFAFSWEPVQNATSYKLRLVRDDGIVILDNKELDLEHPDYNFTFKDGKYSVSITPSEGMYSLSVISTNKNVKSNPRYIDSILSNVKTFGVLATPVGLDEDGKPGYATKIRYSYNESQFTSTFDGIKFDIDFPVEYPMSVDVWDYTDESDKFDKWKSGYTLDYNEYITDPEKTKFTLKYGNDVVELKTNLVPNIDKNVISWNENPLADYYEIWNDITDKSEKIAEVDRNRYEIDVSRERKYLISIRACSFDTDNITASNFSKKVPYEVRKLQPPVINYYKNENNETNKSIITWGSRDDADGYRVYIDNELALITSSTRVNLKDFMAVRAGILKIHVIAFSNKVNLLDSDNSNYMLVRIEKEKKFNIVINGVNYDKIQLPFTMNFTLDETLDTAGLTLAYIDEKHPFERLTPADIIIYESVGASRRFPMVVEKDEVVEVKIGNEIKYKHYLQLIERTVLLQNEIIPDFSVSASIKNLIVKDDAKISPTVYGIPFAHNKLLRTTDGDYGIGLIDRVKWNPVSGMFPLEILLEVLKKIVDTLNLNSSEWLSDEDIQKVREFGWEIPTGVVFFQGIVRDGEVNSLISKNFNPGELFILPDPTSRLSGLCFSIKSVLNSLFEILDLGSFEDFVSDRASMGLASLLLTVLKNVLKIGGKVIGWIAVVVLFLLDYIIYIVKILIGKRGYTWEGLLEKLLTTDLSAIGDIFYTDNDWAFPAKKYYVREYAADGTTKEYEIASYPTSLNHPIGTYSFGKEGTYDLIMEIPTVNMQEVFEKNLIDFDSSIIKGGDSVDLPTVSFNKNGGSLRIEWKGINVRQNKVIADYLKISTVLEKVVSLTNNKYSIDPQILKFTNTLNCPDMTFTNGNYLYDVLEQIGREFYGIPRLLEDNIITFDILDNSTFATRQLSFWTDKDVLGSERQDLDQVASGFISRVSNMVPEEDYTIYPAPGLWTTPRSDNKKNASTYVESFAVSVDKPIYRINRVTIKNAIEGMPEFPLDITEYVYQDVVYNSLNDNAKGKGLALVWSQGDTFIRGLGQLPEESKLFAMLGWQPDRYVIDNIIEDIIAKSGSDSVLNKQHPNSLPGEILFQVEYQGYTNTTLYIENPDRKNNKYAMYSVFNQEDNTISDSRFGNGALTVLKRHNTNMIQKEYQAYSLLKLPLLGESINISNSPYYIDNLTYEFNNEYTKATCNFSKNYNKINPRTAINSEYRQYELKSDTIVDRVINFNEYCILGDNDTLTEKITNDTAWKNIIRDSFLMNNHIKPECFYINCYNDQNLKRISYITTDVVGFDKNDDPIFETVTKNVEGIALPISYNRIGTSINFSASMYDNFSAGFASARENTKPDNLERVQSYVRYVGDDSLNQLPYMRVTIGSLNNYVKNYTTTKNGVKISLADTFPGVAWLDQPTVSLNDVCFSNLFKVYKDQKEALKFNYQMHFISNRDDLFIHKGFTKYIFRQPTIDPKNTKPVLVGYTQDVINKDFIEGQYTKIENIFEVKENYLLFKVFESTYNYKGFALIWPDTKEILLEIRKPAVKGESVSIDPIYFNFTNKIKR